MSPVVEVLLDPILPVFAILALGYAMGWARRMSLETARACNRALMMVFLPILLFGLTSDAPIDAFRIQPLLVYMASQAAVLSAGFVIARYGFGLSAAESFLLAFGTIFVNTVMYILPLSVLMYGDDAVLPIASVTTMDSTLVFAVAVITVQALTSTAGSARRLATSLLKNPMLIAIAFGFAANLSNLALPAPVQTFIEFNAAAAPPLALFALGVVMSQTRFRVDGVVATFCMMKIVALPALVFIGLEQLAPNDPGADLYLFTAAGPAGAMAFTLALLHDVRPDRIGQVIVLTSVITLGSLAALA